MGGIVFPWTRFAVRPDAGCGGTVGADAARRSGPADERSAGEFGLRRRPDSGVNDAGASCSAPGKAKGLSDKSDFNDFTPVRMNSGRGDFRFLGLVRRPLSVPRTRLELARTKRSLPPQSSVSTNFTTWACVPEYGLRECKYRYYFGFCKISGEKNRISRFIPCGFCPYRVQSLSGRISFFVGRRRLSAAATSAASSRRADSPRLPRGR